MSSSRRKDSSKIACANVSANVSANVGGVKFQGPGIIFHEIIP